MLILVDFIRYLGWSKRWMSHKAKISRGRLAIAARCEWPRTRRKDGVSTMTLGWVQHRRAFAAAGAKFKLLASASGASCFAGMRTRKP